LVVGILWYFIKAPSKHTTTEDGSSEVSSLREAFLHVIRIRKVWLFGIVLLGFNGCVQGMLGYLPLYLREMGWTPVSADGTLAGFHGASMAFVLPLAILSDRLGRRKPILVTATFVLAIGVGLLTIAQGNLIWGLVLLVGLFRDGFMAVLVTTIIESEGIGQDYSGSAVGLAMLFSAIGNIFSPPIGNSIAEQQLNAPFLFWASMAALAFIASTFIKERKTQLETQTS
jgi:cyanate permease